VYFFDGIPHIIAADIFPDEKTCARIRAAAEGRFAKPAVAGQPGSLRQPAALGIMFYDTAAAFMRPAVYVYGTDSLVFESSCGSGTAALALWKTSGQGDGEAACAVKQPGGVIEAQVFRRDGGAQSVRIGGTVHLSGRIFR
jgi:diaminopimelate epimerase